MAHSTDGLLEVAVQRMPHASIIGSCQRGLHVDPRAEISTHITSRVHGSKNLRQLLARKFPNLCI